MSTGKEHLNGNGTEAPKKSRGRFATWINEFFFSKKLVNPVHANPLSYAFLSYLNPIVSLARQKPFVLSEDLIPLIDADTAETICQDFQKTWEKEYIAKNGRRSDEPKVDDRPEIAPSMIKVFAIVNKAILFGSFCVELCRATFLLAVPVLLRILVDSLSNPLIHDWYRYVLVVVMFICTAMSTICQDVEYALLYRVSMRLQASIMGGVFRKSMKLSTASQLKAGLGYIMNMCGQDTQRVFYFVGFINLVWSCPAMTIVIFVLIGQLLGYQATLPAVGVLLGTLVLLRWINNQITVIEKDRMQIADKRIKLMNEALNGIKVVKSYAWEGSFAEQISRMRGQELVMIFKLALYRALLFITFLVTPMLMAIVIFYTYVGTGNMLTPPVVFGTLSLINLLRLPLTQFPTMLTTYAAARVSIGRIGQFYLLQEEKPLVDDLTLPKGSIKIEGDFKWPSVAPPPAEEKVFREVDWAVQLHQWCPEGTSSALTNLYGQKLIEAKIKTVAQLAKLSRRQSSRLGMSEEHRVSIVSQAKLFLQASKKDSQLSLTPKDTKTFELNGLSLSVNPNELVEIIGEVGSGKSSLLGAMLGIMESKSGASVRLNGTIAYVPQRAWMRNQTFKDNITFGKPFEHEKYEEVLRMCALTYDRSLLISGDSTEIGEQGINLSGGQKQRISLARAVYSDADIYLLDDPLSAVDQETGKHIFYECIMPYLKKRGKTVILVTHQVQFLEPADRIIVMKKGEISHEGTYEQVKDLEELRGFGQVAETKEEKKKPEKKEAKEEKKEKNADDGKLIKEEQKGSGTVPLHVYGFYVKSMGGGPFLFFLIFFYTFSQGAVILADWWLSAWTGRFFPLSTNQYMAIYGGLAGIGAVTAFIRIAIYANGTRVGAKTIHDSLLTKFLAATMRFFDTTPTARLVDMLSKDQQFVDTYLPLMFDMYIVLALSVLGSLILVGIVTLWFFIPFGVLVVAYVCYQQYFMPSARSVQRLWLMSLAPVLSHLAETVMGVHTVRAYRTESSFRVDNNKNVDKNNNAFYHSQLLTRWLDVRLGIISASVVLATGVCILQIRSTLSIVLAGLALTYAVNITGQLGVMVLFASFTETFMTAVQRMKISLATIPEENYKGQEKSPTGWPSEAKIEFKNVQFKYYPEGPVILDDVSFTIPPRSKIGIVGRTGAGKSTITISLFRLVELSGGSIEIDGQDISLLSLSDLRSRLAIIPQDPVLFDGTVRFNLDPFNTSTDAQIWEALERTRLKDVIQKVEGGLSGAVLPGGTNFSVGQRQLFCMARALLRRTPVLIMDEATASVDPATDELIQRMIREEFRHCTVITIAHRLNTITDSDYILVLADGRVKEFDSPKKLLQNSDSLYAQLMKETHKADLNYSEEKEEKGEGKTALIYPLISPPKSLREHDFFTAKPKSTPPKPGDNDTEETPFLNKEQRSHAAPLDREDSLKEQATIHLLKKDPS